MEEGEEEGGEEEEEEEDDDDEEFAAAAADVPVTTEVEATRRCLSLSRKMRESRSSAVDRSFGSPLSCIPNGTVEQDDTWQHSAT